MIDNFTDHAQATRYKLYLNHDHSTRQFHIENIKGEL